MFPPRIGVANAVISVAILRDYNQTSLQGGQDFGVTSSPG